MTKITPISSPASPFGVSGKPKEDPRWDSELSSSVKNNLNPSAPAVKTFQIQLDRTPQNITNQNAQLSPQQMAQHLSRELAKRTAESKASKLGKRTNIEGDLSHIIENDKALSSLFESGDENTIAAFLAFFQTEMERHLSGMEFGNIIYDKELLEKILETY